MRVPLYLLAAVLSGCDHGLAPPETPPAGAIRGVVTYTGTWPPRSEVRDLRFVALRFIPRDTTDLLQLNRMVFSETLAYGVPADTFFIDNVEAGTFPFSGVAQRFGTDPLAWRPVGLYRENGGLFQVRPGEVTELSLTVDFANPPPFPP
ncbi:hypothetical protein GQ464_017415 [Rhodocaloribacter litoris]|uniref:hypothetical protein n=1 Tax=Rhodocaloribacter litoris TaxID=2558931 RepID=UPI0014228C3E|nr:hypothetical protein [Rhodocaloribacter litoris]QXD15161.1 hypothetical protein GQ464_017415 [Rhodocaloribacter litoris]GIV60475.1 MAG: hypothetical protein KatS3mg043_1564 [Rhodothermaceae bacterium]